MRPIPAKISGMERKAPDDDFVGLHHAREAAKSLRHAEQLLRRLPKGLFRSMRLAPPNDSWNANTLLAWRDGLKDLLTSGYKKKLGEAFAALAVAHKQNDNLTVEMYELWPGVGQRTTFWHPSDCPPLLLEHAVDLINEVDLARELQDQWDWNAEPVHYLSSNCGRDSKDWYAHSVARLVSELDKELNWRLDELYRLSLRVQRTRERNARERRNQSAPDSQQTPADTDGTGEPESKDAKLRGSTKPAIDGEPIDAENWKQCKLILGVEVIATTRQGGRHCKVRLSAANRKALELLASEHETDFGAQTGGRRRSVATELRKLFREVFQVRGGNPILSVGNGRYRSEVLVRDREQLSKSEIEQLALSA